jgi:hypothetical protein
MKAKAYNYEQKMLVHETQVPHININLQKLEKSKCHFFRVIRISFIKQKEHTPISNQYYKNSSYNPLFDLPCSLCQGAEIVLFTKLFSCDRGLLFGPKKHHRRVNIIRFNSKRARIPENSNNK